MKKLLLLVFGGAAIFLGGAYAQEEKDVLKMTKEATAKLKEKGTNLVNKVKDGINGLLKKEKAAVEETAEEVKENVADEKPAE